VKPPQIFLSAGILGATGVGLGAFGAHAMRAFLIEHGTRDRWETAVFYQLVHALALLAAAACARSAGISLATKLGWAARFWVAGSILFCGSLYILALTTQAPLWFKIAVPPLGGTSFIVGWLCVAAAGFGRQE
jgi:uncharacterized membrane protein YgdD (TMEM256/DUF423 family)